MGNSQSIIKNDKRRLNRLSKPPTNTPGRQEEDPVLASGLIGWQNPWVADSNIVTSNRPRPRKIPSTVFESDLEPKQKVPEDFPLSPLSPRSVKVPATPRTSNSKASLSASTKSPSRSSSRFDRLRRANSIQTPLQQRRSQTQDEGPEDATFSNTHFLVGNQRFSLTRRRSLLTRPGIATRRSTGAVRHLPTTPTGEPGLDELESSFMRWSLPPRQRPSLAIAPPERPTSPTDPRFTQLGALKLGSLRVVNGSASPSPSDRIPLDRRPVEVVPQPCLKIPNVADMKKSDDVPGSPFSFEKSPIITVHPRAKALFPRDMEDEGIAMCSDLQLKKDAVDTSLDRSHSESIDKADSGYSSANSLHSVQNSQTRLSLDSQTSSSVGTPEERLQRHLSIQGIKTENYSRPRLASSTRWYDSSNVVPQLGPRARRSTLCAPRSTEYPSASEDAVSGPRKFSLQDEQIFLGSSMSSTASSDIMPVYEQVSALRRSISGRSEAGTSRSRSRSRTGGRIWCQKPGIEVPPLPTIFSPGQSQAAVEKGFEYPVCDNRGRPRSRSQDHRRRRLEN